MKRLLTAAILIPLVLLAVLRAPLWLFLLIAVVVALAAVFEYLGITAGYGFEPFRLLTYIYTAALFVVYYYAQGFGGGSLLAGILLLFMFAPFLLMISAMGREDLKSAMPGAAMSYLALPYIGLPLLLMAMMRESLRGWVMVLFTFFAVWVGDTAAMYVGKSMGRHKLAPRISPGKTIEGSVASLLFSVGVCCMFAHYVPEIAAALGKMHLLAEPAQESLLIDAPVYVRAPLWLAAMMAAVINVAAQVGDLLESVLKRGAGVKDSGNLLPGHGGILDRIDALLLALPVAFLLFLAFGHKFVQG
ncbi:MAG TPA: phosphatidate cytidylyltransferase [Candidatus Saccharimonadales bacterium]|nr:phosphatidate cytidylyltransferase [Candidatus Saccharimonadales bacterium]